MIWRVVIKTIFSLIVAAIIISTIHDLVTEAPETTLTPAQIRFGRVMRIVVDIFVIIWFWVP